MRALLPSSLFATIALIACSEAPQGRRADARGTPRDSAPPADGAGGPDGGVRRDGAAAIDGPATSADARPPLPGDGGASAPAAFERKCKVGHIPGTVSTFSGGDLNAALQGLGNGGTLVIGAGTHSLTSTIYLDGKSDIVVCADPAAARPKIFAAGMEYEAIKVTNSHHVHFEGFELYGNTDKSLPNTSGILVAEGAHHVSIWDTWVHDFSGAGIGSARSQGFLDFRHNRIWNNANWSPYNTSGISFYALENGAGGNNADGYANYIIGNTLWNNRALVPFTIGGSDKITDGNCIIIDATDGSQTGTAPYANRTLIANNLCVNNGGRGVHVFSSAHVDAIHNTCYRNVTTAPDLTGSGELSAIFADDVRFANNIAVASSNGIPASTYGASNVDFTNNLYSGGGAQAQGSGDRVADPAFVDPQLDPRSADFRVAGGSPAIGAGTPGYLTLVPTDLGGKPRPNPPTIGAYEP